MLANPRLKPLMKNQLKFFVLFFTCATTGLHAAPIEATLVADTYIRQSTVNTNYGTDNQMLVGNVSTGPFNGLLRFDLSNIQALGTEGVDFNINSVTLTGTSLTSTAGQGTNFDLAVYEYGSNFVEASATWNNTTKPDPFIGGEPADPLTIVTVANGATLGQTIVFPDSAAFQTSISNALTVGSINLLLSRDFDGDRFIRFQQDDGSNAAPFVLSVDVTVIPEPSTFMLMGLAGVAVLMGLRRRS